MSLLPSGRHWCIHDSPIHELLKSLRIHGLRVPELISIDSIVALRPYLRFMWLLPMGADTQEAVFHTLSPLMPTGLTMVDSGHTLACLPDDLDELDRAAVEAFWHSDRCLDFVKKRYERVQKQREKITLSEAPEDQLLSEWFQGEMTRRDRALEAEIYAIMIERGMIADPKNNSPPPPQMSHPL